MERFSEKNLSCSPHEFGSGDLTAVASISGGTFSLSISISKHIFNLVNLVCNCSMLSDILAISGRSENMFIHVNK